MARRGRERTSGFFVIASAAKQSILSLRGQMDCFASLAMTERVARECADPLARNDVIMRSRPSSPANGSAEWPPDDRLRRAIQYSEA